MLCLCALLAVPPPAAYRTGLGDETAVCPAIQSGDPKQLGIEAARFEFGATCFTTISELLHKTGVSPRQVDYVITNSSLFNPTPSLSAAIMNHFKMSSKTLGYSLGGMGCSGGCLRFRSSGDMVRYIAPFVLQ
jgi:3-ketoacyl-CoA synthase